MRRLRGGGVAHRVITVPRALRRRDDELFGPRPAVPLTGAFDTARLPVIAAEPVTVTVARRVLPGHEAEFLRWTDDLLDEARRHPGFLGGGVLHPGDAGGEYHVMVRFADGLSLRRWERSSERQALMTQAEPFVTATRLQRTVGVDEWFEAAGNASPPAPTWRRVLADVAWVYPVSLAMAVFVAPAIAELALGERVLLGATLITIAMTVAVGPVRRWLRKRRRL
jgi:uncharacterized protein